MRFCRFSLRNVTGWLQDIWAGAQQMGSWSEPLTVWQSIVILGLSVCSRQNVCHCYLSSCISFPHCLVPVLLPTPLGLSSNCYFTDDLVRSEKVVVHDPDRDWVFIDGVAVHIKQETLIPDRIHSSSCLGLPSFQYCFICIQIHTDVRCCKKRRNAVMT